MATTNVAGLFETASGPTNGAQVDLWLTSRFGGQPAFGTAPPSGSPDYGPVTTGTAFGAPGSWTINAVAEGDYYVRASYLSTNYWGGSISVIENSDLVHITGSETISGAKTFSSLITGSAGLTINSGSTSLQGTSLTTLAASGAVTGSSTVTGTALIPSGLTGATTGGTRYAGSTAGGAPATGTFVAGDMIIDALGYMWICKTGGSPGTWWSPAMGEVARTSLTAATSVITSTTQPGTNVTTLVYTFSSLRKYRIRAFGTVVFNTDGAIAAAALFSATPGASNGLAECNTGSVSSQGQAPFYVEAEVDGTLSGSTTIYLNGWVTTGNLQFSGSSPPSGGPTQTVLTIDDIGAA